ncbi:hypothetical protein CSPX01_13176 [Colletotrichum filicis]|nr:hypothetical protein CSPX01_13176 [Colletotrichum filicis]
MPALIGSVFQLHYTFLSPIDNDPDGGGIRGLSELIILDEIMKRIKHDLKTKNDLLPADFFDIIGGTSTGGLNALLLGRMRFTVPQAIQAYKKIAKEVFSITTFAKTSKFDATKLERAVKDLAQEETMLDHSQNPCKVFVCTVLQKDAAARAGPRLFRTYEVRENSTFDCKIWEASRATSAAPSYFDPISIGEVDEEEIFIDGGLGYNNPIQQLLNEAQKVFPKRRVACVVSVGTGLSKAIKFPKPKITNLLKLVNALKDITTEADRIAEDTSKRFQGSDGYYRFNVDRGLSDFQLDEWENMPQVRTYTTEYLNLADVSAQIDKVVVALLASRARHEGDSGSVVPVTPTGSSHGSSQETPLLLPWNREPGSLPSFSIGVESFATTITSRCPTLLRPVWAVPFERRRSHFVGRETLLSRISSLIPPCKDKNDCQRTVIEGLGGVGKTRVAIEAAFRLRDQYNDCSVFWVPAVDSTSFEVSYREISRKIQTGITQDDKTDIRTRVKAALSSEEAGPWLMIVDNADDSKILFGEAGLLNYLPVSQQGSILFTTRDHGVAVALGALGNNHIIVGLMDRADATKLLTSHLTENQTNDSKSVDDLLDFLEDLPLAIKQVSAYMSTMRISAAKYLELCRKNEETLTELLNRDFEDPSRYNGNTNAVAKTWLISFNRISETHGCAADLLKFICFLAEKQIPAALLPGFGSTLEFTEAIGILKAFAFISERANRGTFDTHRLVRLSMSIWLAQKGQRMNFMAQVMQRLADVFPHPDYDNKEVWTVYLPHTQRVLDFWECTGIREFEELPLEKKSLRITEAILRDKMGFAFERLSKFKEAQKMHSQALSLRVECLGKKARDTLTSRDNLGRVLCYRDEYIKAREQHVKALELRKSNFGRKDPDTLTSMNSLGVTMSFQQEFESAEELLRKTLKLRVEVLGNDDRRTLETSNNLGLVLNFRGKYQDAKHQHQRTLLQRKFILGPKHPDTLASMNSLGLLQDTLNERAEAVGTHRETLRLRREVLGRNHAQTVDSMNNLAKALAEMSDDEAQEAEDLYREALRLRKEILGERHRKTVATKNGLVRLLESIGKDFEAYEIQGSFQ